MLVACNIRIAGAVTGAVSTFFLFTFPAFAAGLVIVTVLVVVALVIVRPVLRRLLTSVLGDTHAPAVQSLDINFHVLRVAVWQSDRASSALYPFLIQRVIGEVGTEGELCLVYVLSDLVHAYS
jgi:hypothetical protein